MAGGLDVRGMAFSLAAHDVSSLAADELASVVLESQVLVKAALAYASAVLEEFDRRGGWADEGARSAAAWAAPRTGPSTRDLAAQGNIGKALQALPSAAEAARAGRLSRAHLGALSGCVRQHPELAARDEQSLVGQALELGATAFRAAAHRWCAQASVAGDTPAPVSELSLTKRADGTWAVEGRLTARDGALVNAVVQAHLDAQLRAQRDGDPSVALTGGQLAAQALVDLFAQQLRCEPGKPTVPDRYRVGLIVRPDEVEDLLGDEACDATFYRVVLGAEGEPLDVGRDTRRWAIAIRRAITARDRGCIFPGCDRPPSWCDVHHGQHWDAGGGTSVDNGALLCRRHHTFIHNQNWKVNVEHGEPVVHRDDGTKYVIRRWEAA